MPAILSLVGFSAVAAEIVTAAATMTLASTTHSFLILSSLVV
jgi:hypothetical protein